jgi:hypothetical protein
MRFPCASRIALFLLAAAFALPAHPASGQTMTKDEMAAKLVSLMKADGYGYRTTDSPTVFVIHFVGTNIQDIKVILAVGGDEDANLVVFVTVTEKRRLPVTTDFMRMLLEKNHELDQVKVAYDADGDLEVRFDASLRLCDGRYLQNIVTQVKSSADGLYGDIAPSLLP